MIDYDPHHWRHHLFDWKGSVLKQILYRMLAVVVWAAIVAVADHLWMPLEAPSTVHSLVGVALGLLLVFRTNASYDRFWEGRKLWGSIVNETRNLARHSHALIKPGAPTLHEEILRLAIAFPYACMNLLRGVLPADPGHPLHGAQHPPLAISVRITELLRDAQKGGVLSEYARVAADQNLQLLIDCIGACERIHKTPLPFAYVVHLRRALLLYCLSLPFVLVKDFGTIWTLLAVTFVSLIFFGIEEIGVQIEDPFGLDDNDLPLEAICGTIEQNLLALAKLPAAAPQNP